MSETPFSHRALTNPRTIPLANLTLMNTATYTATNKAAIIVLAIYLTLATRLARRPNGYRRLLTSANAKTSKGELMGYFTGILYLSPATESGIINTCLFATIECMLACLGAHAGRNVMTNNKLSRLWKTHMLVENRALFLDCLRWDIGMIIRRAAKLGMKPAVRINGSSDMPWIVMLLSAEFPDVMFYDYTKLPKPYLRTRSNYSITFSYSGHNIAHAMDALSHGVNVAVVFNTRKGQPLPESWNGYRVIDGDAHDLRFLDDKGVVVGLRAKGAAIKQDSAFIVKSELIQISAAA